MYIFHIASMLLNCWESKVRGHRTTCSTHSTACTTKSTYVHVMCNLRAFVNVFVLSVGVHAWSAGVEGHLKGQRSSYYSLHLLCTVYVIQ